MIMCITVAELDILSGFGGGGYAVMYAARPW